MELTQITLLSLLTFLGTVNLILAVWNFRHKHQKTSVINLICFILFAYVIASQAI